MSPSISVLESHFAVDNKSFSISKNIFSSNAFCGLKGFELSCEKSLASKASFTSSKEYFSEVKKSCGDLIVILVTVFKIAKAIVLIQAKELRAFCLIDSCSISPFTKSINLS